MFRPSTGPLEGITLFRVLEPPDITPEPDEEEREAILAALAADAAAPTPAASGWADALLPARDGEGGEPYPE
jgi:hypothetical protein